MFYSHCSSWRIQGWNACCNSCCICNESEIYGWYKDGWSLLKSLNFQYRLIFPKNKLLAYGVLLTVSEGNANTELNV